MTSTSTLLVRPAGPSDSGTIRRLAALDSAAAPREPVLLAEVDGRAVAALAPRSGAVVADPFRHTAEIVRALSAAATAYETT